MPIALRRIEASAIYEEFKSKEGTIIHGTIHKCERGGAVVKIGETLAFLPKSLMIPGEKCSAGYTIRALLKEVLPEPRNDNQLILDRASELFLQRLFELEIPEVFEKLVEIKKIVRTRHKSKLPLFHMIKILILLAPVWVWAALVSSQFLKNLAAKKLMLLHGMILLKF